MDMSVAKKAAAIGLLTLSASSIFGAAAMASQPVSPRTTGPLAASTTGASFSGSYLFNAPGTNHGGFEFYGYLSDTSCSDGNNVKTEAAPEGYGFSSFYGTQCAKVHQDDYVYIGDQTYVSYAYWKVCRDRGTLYPDNCSATYRKNR